MLRTYVMQQPTKWEDYLHLMEFTYNNSYHESLHMSSFECLYGHKCRSPLSWSGVEEKLLLGPDMLEEIEETVKKVDINLKAAQDRKKNFCNQKSSFQEFEVGYHVYIRVQANKRTLQWAKCAKLAPRYCGSFQILARIGMVAYQLALPSHIHVHSVFHVSLLK